MYKRIRNEKTLNILKNELLKQNWNIIYEENEANKDKTNKTFLGVFKILFDKNCPVVKDNRKYNYTGGPWMTKVLQNACKKNNTHI